MPRFVILRHDTPPDYPRAAHWDLMLEERDHLRCWALSRSPDDAEPQPAEALSDHRAAYLEYEGPLAENRGSVSRWDEGTYRTLRASDDEIVVQLSGGRLRGQATLTRRGEREPYWCFSFSSA